jgi:hypothetical protein
VAEKTLADREGFSFQGWNWVSGEEHENRLQRLYWRMSGHTRRVAQQVVGQITDIRGQNV